MANYHFIFQYCKYHSKFQNLKNTKNTKNT